MTYEITIESGSNSHSTRRQFATMDEAVAWAENFAADWWRGAEYQIYCVDNEACVIGQAN